MGKVNINTFLKKKLNLFLQLPVVIFLYLNNPLHDLCYFLFIYIPFLDFVGRRHLQFNAYVSFSLGGQLGPYPDSTVSAHEKVSPIYLGPYKLST